MTTADDMIAHLKDEPESDIVAAMLVDELMESRGMSRVEADKKVKDLRENFGHWKPIWKAERLLRLDVAFRVFVREQMAKLSGLGTGTNFRVLVVEGDTLPELVARGAECQEEHNYGAAVRVGADMVANWWHAWFLLLPRREQAKRKGFYPK